MTPGGKSVQLQVLLYSVELKQYYAGLDSKFKLKNVIEIITSMFYTQSMLQILSTIILIPLITYLVLIYHLYFLMKMA